MWNLIYKADDWCIATLKKIIHWRPKFWLDNNWEPVDTSKDHWVTVPNPKYRRPRPMTPQEQTNMMIATLIISDTIDDLTRRG